MTRPFRLLTHAIPLLVLASAAGCSPAPTLPPLAQGGEAETIPGKFVWHNLVTSDAELARAFYADLFGWEFEVVAEGRYSVIRFEGRNIGGIIDASKDEVPLRAAQWLGAISVPDLDAALNAIEKAGGRQLEAPIDVPGVGRVVTVEDDGGAVLHLLEATGGDPPDVTPAFNAWLWNELLASDPDRATTFYTTVFDYELEEVPRQSRPSYLVLSRGGRPRAGVIQNPFDDSDSAWVPYVRVQDATAFASRVAALGGTVVVAPSADVRDGTLALVLDPSGAPVALQEWSPAQEVEP